MYVYIYIYIYYIWEYHIISAPLEVSSVPCRSSEGPLRVQLCLLSWTLRGSDVMTVWCQRERSMSRASDITRSRWSRHMSKVSCLQAWCESHEAQALGKELSNNMIITWCEKCPARDVMPHQPCSRPHRSKRPRRSRGEASQSSYQALACGLSAMHNGFADSLLKSDLCLRFERKSTIFSKKSHCRDAIDSPSLLPFRQYWGAHSQKHSGGA